MTACYLVRLGRQGAFVSDAVDNGYVGVDYGMIDDFTGRFPDQWTAFNKANIPRFLELNPGKTKVAAGLACGTLWTIGRGLEEGDYVVTPTSSGALYIGRVTGPYEFVSGAELPHRRAVSWQQGTIAKDEMSAELQRSTTYPGTVANITVHLPEVMRLLQPVGPVEPGVEDPVQFALEKYLEEFLVDNWAKTELGKAFDIYPDEEGIPIGRQYLTDTGPLDILAISKDRTQLLVVELKRGKASDASSDRSCATWATSRTRLPSRPRRYVA